VLANGKRVRTPSYACRVEDVVEIKDSPKARGLATRNLEITTSRNVPDWLVLNRDAMKGSVNRIPTREDLQPIANEQTIVEFYSR
jgi:small subunit ribosomal protein S4